MFQDYNMNPQDMDFQVIQMQSKTFDTMLEMIASFSPDQCARKRNETNCKRTKYRQQLLVLLN